MPKKKTSYRVVPCHKGWFAWNTKQLPLEETNACETYIDANYEDILGTTGKTPFAAIYNLQQAERYAWLT